MRLIGLTRTKLAHAARMAASPAASILQTARTSRDSGASRGTSRPSAARRAAAWARPLVKAGASAAHVHSSQPGRVAR
jgi:hypothetical protein